jgi:hypothetical protein
VWTLRGGAQFPRASHSGSYGLSLSGEASGPNSALIDCCCQSRNAPFTYRRLFTAQIANTVVLGVSGAYNTCLWRVRTPVVPPR